jgi:hypothetical protein
MRMTAVRVNTERISREDLATPHVVNPAIAQATGSERGTRAAPVPHASCPKCRVLRSAWLPRTHGLTTLLAELSETIGIPIVKLIEIKEGRTGGTWVHPDVTPMTE